MLDGGDVQGVQGRGASGTGLGTTVVVYAFFVSCFKCGCRGPLLDLLCSYDSAIFRPTTALYASGHVRICSQKVVVVVVTKIESIYTVAPDFWPVNTPHQSRSPALY